MAVMGGHSVDKNVIQDLSGRVGGDIDFTRVGPLGGRVSGAVDVQISQVDVIDALVGSVAGNVDAVPVATRDLEVVDLPVLLIEQLHGFLCRTSVDDRLSARSV